MISFDHLFITLLFSSVKSKQSAAIASFSWTMGRVVERRCVIIAMTQSQFEIVFVCTLRHKMCIFYSNVLSVAVKFDSHESHSSKVVKVSASRLIFFFYFLLAVFLFSSATASTSFRIQFVCFWNINNHSLPSERIDKESVLNNDRLDYFTSGFWVTVHSNVDSFMFLRMKSGKLWNCNQKKFHAIIQK